MEEILRTFIKVLFSNETMIKAENLKNSANNRTAIDQDGIAFRLEKSKSGNINLEFFSQDQFGMFYKPIGFYEFDIFGKITEIYVLNEFVGTFEKTKSNLTNIHKARFLNLLDNVYVALGSREVGNAVTAMFNSPNYSEYNHMDFTKRQFQSLEANGLKIDVKTSMMGALEAVFIDKNNVFDEDYFIMFKRNNGRTSLHCSEFAYNEMKNKGLLTIF